jgi:hypothetical protein
MHYRLTVALLCLLFAGNTRPALGQSTNQDSLKSSELPPPNTPKSPEVPLPDTLNASARLNRLLQLDAAARKSGDSIRRLKIALQLKALLNDAGDGTLAVAHAYSVLKDSALAFESLMDYARLGLADKKVCNGEDKKFSWLAGSPRFQTICQLMEKNTEPVSQATSILSFRDTGYIPEDIDYDRQSRSFLFTSVLRHAIFRLAPDGRSLPFATSPSGWPTMAIKIDQTKGLVWATEMAIPGFGGLPDSINGLSAVCCFDLRTGHLMERFEAPEGSQWGDMILDGHGIPIVCDGQSGAIFRLREHAWQRMDKGDFISPQTPVLTTDGKYLIVPDYVRGLALMDIENGSVTWIRAAPEHPCALSGVDGAYLVKDKLYLTQNGVNPERVVEIDLDSSHKRIEACTPIERATLQLGDPTHGVMVDGRFYYIANSGWNALDEHGKIKPGSRMTQPVLMRYPK